MRRLYFGLLAVSAANSAGVAPAQQGPDVPLARILGYTARSIHRDVATDEAAARQPTVIARMGAPAGGSLDWLSPADPAYALIKRDPKLSADAEVKITFNSAGNYESCTVVKSTGSKALLSGLCNRLRPRARLIPAMSRDGRTYSESLTLFVKFNGGGVPPPPLIAPPDIVPWPRGMPPTYAQATSLIGDGLPTYGPGPSAIPPNSAITGVVVRIESGRTTRCQVGRSSGDPMTDTHACELALRATYRSDVFDVSSSAYPLSLPILFVGKGSQIAALLPRSQRATSAQPNSDVIDELAPLVTSKGGELGQIIVRAAVDGQGHAFDCWLTRGSGSDQADLAVCNYLMSSQRFHPGQDIFGRLAESHIYWQIGKEVR